MLLPEISKSGETLAHNRLYPRSEQNVASLVVRCRPTVVECDLQVLDLQRALHADPTSAGRADTLSLRDITAKNKVTDKFKRPFKKRHSSVYHQPSNRVNKYLSQAIEARSVDREKSNHVNLITLCFKDKEKENQYHTDVDVGFSSSLACSLVLLFLMGGLQAVILPRTIILLLLFLTAFIWISVVLMLLLAVRLRWILCDISHSFSLRLAITVFTIVLVYTVAQVNVFTCRTETPCHPANITSATGDHRACPLPHYIVISCSLGYMAVAVFLRLPILIKCALLALMATVYILLIELSHINIFHCYDTRVQSVVPSHLLSVVYVLMLLLAVIIHGRQVEWTARLDFLWQIQSEMRTERSYTAPFTSRLYPQPFGDRYFANLLSERKKFISQTTPYIHTYI
ncbi:Adenylate cyclase type 1 [Homalodisca vitripennis]|nr:Adenylate cyclase type 1 [Homalodisca vitripennis]